MLTPACGDRSAASRCAAAAGVMSSRVGVAVEVAERVADAGEIALELVLVPAVVLEADELDDAAGVDHVVGRVEDSGFAQSLGVARARRAGCSPSPATMRQRRRGIDSALSVPPTAHGE